MDLSTFNTKFRDYLIEELTGDSSDKLESLAVVFTDLVNYRKIIILCCISLQ